ncbi:MAG: type II toxin-antitoxin system VapC family toxin [Desulfovibrio sp.]|jgi:predicted nucleic acid-binding protein|nr:type II toxin-antitoxin system VapC family toxin [Desulfovibrio sp.]
MIIDTMVMAYALLGVPEYGEESIAALHKADALYSPASVQAELLNVVWQYGKRGVTAQRAAEVYDDASRLWTKLIPVERLWPEALSLAFSSGHSPYDTLFVAAARMYHTSLLTYDQKLLTSFPDETVHVGTFLRT